MAQHALVTALQRRGTAIVAEFVPGRAVGAVLVLHPVCRVIGHGGDGEANPGHGVLRDGRAEPRARRGVEAASLRARVRRLPGDCKGRGERVRAAAGGRQELTWASRAPRESPPGTDPQIVVAPTTRRQRQV